MACMLFFQSADNDCMCIPSKQVTSIENDGDGSVHVSFLNSGAAGGVIGVAELSATDGKEDDAVKAIARACMTGRGVVTIADDIKGIYIDGITAAGTITPGS